MSDSGVGRGIGRRAFLGGMAGLGTTALLTACGGSSDPAGSPGASAESEAEAPKRVVALSTGHLDTCLAVGITPVGLATAVSESTDSRGIPQFIRDRFGADHDLDSIQLVGERMNPSVEKVAALKPDLILSNKRNAKDLNDRLAALARTVQTAGGSENFKTDHTLVAEALGRGKRGAEVLADYQRRAREWGAARGTADSISLVRGKGSQYLYFGTLSLASIVATDAGLTRPQSQRFDDKASRDLSLERADLLDADWLFHAFPGDTAAFTEQDVWKRIPVVARGRAFPVDVDPWFLNASVVAADRVLADLQKFLR